LSLGSKFDDFRNDLLNYDFIAIMIIRKLIYHKYILGKSINKNIHSQQLYQ